MSSFDTSTDLVVLKSRLEASAEQLLVSWLGEPTTKTARNWRWGRKGSFSYDLERHQWFSFEADKGGDLLELIRFFNPGYDFRKVVDWAREWLGDAPMPVRRFSPAYIARRRTAKAAELALKLWAEARPAAGTIVATYLRQRGLDLPWRSDEALRFHPACPRGGLRLPAMLGLMRDIHTDQPVGIHRTFLRADGLAKAAIDPNKMMLGPSRNAVLKLTPDDDVTMGLSLTEGIEDGLAVLADGGGPAWVCLSAGGMMAFPVLDGIEALTIYSDNDAPGIKAAEICAHHWNSNGRETRIVEPPRRVKDFGDVAQEKRHG
jgi:putative DNA primase/helicase